MLFRRSGHTEERRRRVLSDTLSAYALGEQPSGWEADFGALRDDAERKSLYYGDAAFLDEQLHPTDFIPKRLITIFVLLLCGGGLIAGLEALYLWMPRLAAWTGGGRIAALDLAVCGSLATWFSSMALALAAVTAVVVYTVRRYKSDDYRGYYRVWLWAALCWTWLSLDTTADLREGLAGLLVALTGTRLMGDGSIWWAIAYAFLIGSISTRLLVDMRSCRLSAAAFMLGWGCYLAALAVRFGGVEVPDPVQRVMVIQGAVLIANLLLLGAMLLHARYVVLDAQGLIRHRRRPLPAGAEDGDIDDGQEANWRGARSAGSGRNVAIHPPHGVPRPASAPAGNARLLETAPVFTPAGPVSTPASAAPPTAGLSKWPVQRKLTKQEKRVLRERLERLRRERQARGG